MDDNRYVSFSSLLSFYNNLAAKNETFENTCQLLKKISELSSTNSMSVSRALAKLKDSFELKITYTDSDNQQWEKTFIVNCQDITDNSTPSTSDWLKFTAKANNCSVTLEEIGMPSSINLLFSLDGLNWGVYFTGNTIKLNNNQFVYLKAGTTSDTQTGKNQHFSSENDYYKFNISGNIEISGNIMSLLDASLQSTTIPSSYCFNRLFLGVTQLTEITMTATNLKPYCFNKIFSGCTNLSKVKFDFTVWSNATTDWLENVAATGELECDTSLEVLTPSNSTIPSGWEIKSGPLYTEGLLHWFDCINGLDKTSSDPTKFVSWTDTVDLSSKLLTLLIIGEDGDEFDSSELLNYMGKPMPLNSNNTPYQYAHSYYFSKLFLSGGMSVSGELSDPLNFLPIYDNFYYKGITGEDSLFSDAKSIEIVFKKKMVDMSDIAKTVYSDLSAIYTETGFSLNLCNNGYTTSINISYSKIYMETNEAISGTSCYITVNGLGSNFSESLYLDLNTLTINYEYPSTSGENVLLSVYLNGTLISEVYSSYQSYNVNNEFFLLPGLLESSEITSEAKGPNCDLYSVRTYDHVLTSDEITSNHQADLNYYGLL